MNKIKGKVKNKQQLFARAHWWSAHMMCWIFWMFLFCFCWNVYGMLWNVFDFFRMIYIG